MHGSAPTGSTTGAEADADVATVNAAVNSEAAPSSTGLPVTENWPVRVFVVGAFADPLNPGCLPPTEISKTPGSITLRVSLVISDSSRGSIVNDTCCDAPALMVMRQNPTSFLMGTGAEALRSVM